MKLNTRPVSTYMKAFLIRTYTNTQQPIHLLTQSSCYRWFFTNPMMMIWNEMSGCKAYAISINCFIITAASAGKRYYKEKLFSL